ncbi:MAG: Hpt domain-containing protein [Alkalispirochaeta sp.]
MSDSSEIFDRQELLRSIHGDHELLEQFIRLFHTDFPAKIQALRAALPTEDGADSGKSATLRTAAHKILGSARTMRLKRLAVAAEDLQRTIDTGTYAVEDVTAAAHRVIEEYHRVVELLSRGTEEGTS